MQLSFAQVATNVEVKSTENGLFGSYVAQTKTNILYDPHIGDYKPLSAFGSNEDDAFKALQEKFDQLPEGTIIQSRYQNMRKFRKLPEKIWEELSPYQRPSPSFPTPSLSL